MGVLTGDEKMVNGSLAQRFEVSDLIGRGGIGEVYRAIDIETGEEVAIKVLKPGVLGSDPEIALRFAQEGHALRQLNHPNIVKVLDTIEESDHQCIIMELVRGGTLSDLIRENGALPVEQVLKIGLELADALSRAHHLKIIHRDIKPANILLAEDGTPRLTDFGVARIGDSLMTQDGVVMGTFAYLSPEGTRGEVLDVRSDIWSYGVVMFEMLTGRRPFDATQPAVLINAILTQPIPSVEDLRPDSPMALNDLIYRMLEKGRDARIPRMRMVGAEIEAIIEMIDSGIRPGNLILDSDKSLFDTPTAEDPPTQTPSRELAPSNLPVFATPFVGRSEGIRELNKLLNDNEQRLITLLGPGGIGKTRLAVATASANRDVFASGVFFVPLAPITNPDNLLSTIAENVNFTFSGGDDPQDDLIAFLREKKMLIIMDNFEHLMDHAEIVSDILKGAPYVKLLVTSRERLRLRGETAFEVDAMSTPYEDESVEAMEEYPVVKLFLQSAHRVAGDFELNAETAPHVARVINLVGGVPLGVELAAAWLEALSVKEIVAEIENSLDFLETDLRDVPERHRSLRAVFEYSWLLMTEEEQNIFKRLSVFRGGFERDAAHEVTGASLRNLMAMVNKSFLRRAPDGRYIPHKMLREYAEELYGEESDAQQQARQKHAEYYGKFLNEQGSKFNTKAELKAVDSIEREIENIRAAWCWAVDNGHFDALAMCLDPLMLFHQARSMLMEGSRTFRELADRMAAQGMGNTDLYWRARLREARLSQRLGAYAESFELAKDALEYFKDKDQTEESVALNLMSYSRMMQGHYEESVNFASSAAEIAYAIEDTDLIFYSLGNLGYARYLKGDHIEAQNIYEELNRLGENLDYSPIGKAFGLNNLGEIVHAMGDFKRARELYQGAYDIFKKYGTKRGMAFTLNNLGGVHFSSGDIETARQLYQKAYKLNKEIGDRDGMAHSLSALGNEAMFQNDLDAAESYYRQALQIRREIGNKRRIADSLDDLTATANFKGNVLSAKDYVEESLAIRYEINDAQHLATTLVYQAFVKLAEGNLSEAKKYATDGYSLAENAEQWISLFLAQLALAEIDAREGSYDQALTRLKMTLQKAEANGHVPQRIELFIVAAVAGIYAKSGRQDKAVAYAAYVFNESRSDATIATRRAQQVMDDLRNSVPVTVMERGQQVAKSLDRQKVLNDILND